MFQNKVVKVKDFVKDFGDFSVYHRISNDRIQNVNFFGSHGLPGVPTCHLLKPVGTLYLADYEVKNTTKEDKAGPKPMYSLNLISYRERKKSLLRVLNNVLHIVPTIWYSG